MTGRWRSVGGGVVGLLLLGCSASESEQVAETTGRELFVRYCASCHGSSGAGDGPVAPSLATKPADLTGIAERAGGDFDAQAVMATIDGRKEVAAHGSREMPVWGSVLTRGEIASIVEYLHSLQESGAD